MDNVLSQVQSLLPTDNGTWSVYVCNLAKNTEGAINDQKMQAASLIKLYIMGAVYEDYDSLSTTYGKETLDNNLNSMITVSDNDAANKLVNCLGGGDDAAGIFIGEANLRVRQRAVGCRLHDGQQVAFQQRRSRNGACQ